MQLCSAVADRRQAELLPSPALQSVAELINMTERMFICNGHHVVDFGSYQYHNICVYLYKNKNYNVK